MKNKNQLWGKVVLGVLFTLTMVLGGFSSKANAAITRPLPGIMPSSNASVAVSESGEVTRTLVDISSENSGTVTITNSGEGTAKVTLDIESEVTTEGTSYRTPYISPRYDGGPEVIKNGDTNASVILKKGEKVSIDIEVKPLTGSTQKVFKVRVKLNSVVEKNYNVSGDENKPVNLAFGQKVEGPLYGEGLYKQYFKFSLQNAAEITGSFTGDTGTLELFSSGGYQKARVYAGGNISCKLEPGTYYVTVMTAGINQIYFGKAYTIDFVKKDFNWGKVTFNQSLKNGTVSVKATLSGADSRAYISRVTLGTEYENNGGKAASVTVQHLDALLSAGYHTVTAHIDGGDFGTVERTFTYAKKPSTQYKMRLVQYVPASSKGPELTSKPSKTITFTTGSASKPAIKSIKISNIKYKEKVTLKSNLKGKGVQGLCADLTNYKKGKGKTFTFSLSVTGKPKSARIVITSYTDSTMGGHCSSVVKKVKLK